MTLDQVLALGVAFVAGVVVGAWPFELWSRRTRVLGGLVPERAAPSSDARSRRTGPVLHRFGAPRHPTRMDMPVARPRLAAIPPAPRLPREYAPLRVSDDSDDDLWLRRSLDIEVTRPEGPREPSSHAPGEQAARPRIEVLGPPGKRREEEP